MRPRFRVVCLGVLAWAALPAPLVRADAPRPNIVHIFADDLGWGSVGFNGQTQIATPNLDAIANAGMRLTNSYSAPVCAPSRAMLLTGMHQGHSSVDGNDALNSGFRAQDVMTPQVLAPAGYASAVFGKWGFGADGVRNLAGSDPVPTITAPASLPTNHGFSTFYGYLNHGAAHDYFYEWMWQNQAGAPNGVATVANHAGAGGSPQYTHDLFAAQSEQFVAAHAGDASPFYMQVNYTIPHWDIDAVASAPGGLGAYASQPWTTQQKAYAAMITRMDASIGSLIARLDDPNNDGNHADSILSNTLVVFTSDNGPSTEDNSPIDFFDANGQYRGGKFEVYEGGIYMPAVAYWPGTIAPGSVSNYRTDLADFMATAADLAGVDAPVGIDGTSIAPTLTGEGNQRQRDYLVFEHQGAHGADADPRIGRWAVIRQDGMKLIRYDTNPIEDLFNLNTDPGESSPLNLATPANAQIAAELRAAAIAEGVQRGVVEYRTYTGPNGGNVRDDSSWDGIGRPHGYWSASITNTGATPRIAHVSDDVTTLGIEVRGNTDLQVVDVHDGYTLTGRNEVRIGNHGRVDMSGGTLATSRWVNVRAGGELRGKGNVVGDVYNQGVVSPGRPNDAPAWPVAPPPALPPITLDTGVVTGATFNFAGVQDDVPLLATSVQNQYVEVTKGLDFGPGVGPRQGNGGTDKGSEFNVAGHDTNSLANAITAGDYLTFTVDPVAGAGIVPSSVSFRVWRNSAAAATNFAIFSSVGGFTSGAALLTQSISTFGVGTDVTLMANIPAVEAVSGPIEYRLYAWNANSPTGNTHVNLASLNSRFVAVPTLEFNFTGVQDGAPLTALKRQDASLALTAGLNFGPGLAPRRSDNVGNEFHVADFATGSTQQSALDGGDFLSFAVQAVSGMAMYPDSVSFTLWRQGSGSATDYAVLSSVGGFASGQELSQAHLTTVGTSNRLELTGSFAGAQPTTDPVEFRLYGWNAATSLDSTHLVAASMRARFASVVGSPIDPTGSITVQGDFFHLQGGVIAIDLGGIAAGVDYDVVDVLGKVELTGDLSVSLADVGGNAFTPALGDNFQILAATQGITGQFDEVALPLLPWNLDWRIDYLSTAVMLTVLTTGDFNRDGIVDSADYVVWRKNGGTQAEYNAWRANFGATVGSGAGVQVHSSPSMAVPEPATALMLILGPAVASWRGRSIASRWRCSAFVSTRASYAGRLGGISLVLLVSVAFDRTASGSDHPGNVHVAGEDVRVAVPETWAAWRAVDVDGNEVGHGTVGEGTAELGKLPTGYFEVLEKDGPGKVTAAVLAKTTPTENTPIAVDAAMSWFYPDAQQIRDACTLCRLAGVTWVRDRSSWPEIETARGTWAEDGRYERAMRIEHEAGLKVLQVNHISPAWATNNPSRFPDDLQVVYEFYRGLAGRWKGLADAIEPWNEPDIDLFGGHTGCEIASFQKAAYLGLKAGNPQQPVCGSCFAIDRAETLAEFGANEVYPYFDRYDLHHYIGLPAYPRAYGRHRAVSGGRSMWTTEFNLPVWWADEKTKEPSEEELRVQGYRVAKVFAHALHEGAEKAFYFILGDYVERNLQYGLVHHDLTPRPAYVAFAAVGRLLNGAQPIGRVDLGNGKLKGYVFRTAVDGAERETLVAWSETKETTVHIRPTEKVYDYLGREMPYARTVELSRATVFLVLPRGGSKELKVEPPPAKAEWRSGEACPVVLQLIGKGNSAHSAFQLDETNELRLVVYNFGEKTARGKLSVEGATGGTGEVEIGPGGREERTINADGPGKVSVRLGMGDVGHAVVSGRVLTMAPATNPSK